MYMQYLAVARCTVDRPNKMLEKSFIMKKMRKECGLMNAMLKMAAGRDFYFIFI
jgi:hypothetical protein